MKIAKLLNHSDMKLLLAKEYITKYEYAQTVEKISPIDMMRKDIALLFDRQN